MSERTITINGVTYLRPKDAAREVHVTSDHITRLARNNCVDAQRVNGLWFVNLFSLNAFIADQKRQREAFYAELARMRREEQIAAGHPSVVVI